MSVLGSRVIFDDDILNKLDVNSVIDPLGKKVLIVSGQISFSLLGEKLREILLQRGLSVYVEFLSGRGLVSKIDQLINIYERIGVNLVIGVGGGSIADIAKYISHRLKTRLIMVPTVLSTNAIASPFSVLYSEDNKLYTLRTKAPDLIIADLKILREEPRRFILSGIGDLLAKITSIYDYKLAHFIAGEPYNKVAVEIARGSLSMLLRNLGTISSASPEGIKMLLTLLILDGYIMDLANTSRVVAGCEHQVAYGIEHVAGKGLHGELVALGVLICSYLQNKNYIKIIDLFKRHGLPVHPSDIDVSVEEFINALSIAHSTRNWYTILGMRGFANTDIIKELLRDLGII